MSECDHNCEGCGQDCAQRTGPQSLLEPLNEMSRVDRVVAVVSGKGGVGKSSVTSMLACAYSRRGHRAAILDADVTGPSIPKNVWPDREGERGRFQLPSPSLPAPVSR